MIQPLRTAHRQAWLALAVLLSLILLAGLMAREPRPALSYESDQMLETAP